MGHPHSLGILPSLPQLKLGLMDVLTPIQLIPMVKTLLMELAPEHTQTVDGVLNKRGGPVLPPPSVLATEFVVTGLKLFGRTPRSWAVVKHSATLILLSMASQPGIS